MTTSVATEIFTLEEGRRYIALSESVPGTAHEIVVHSDYPGDVSCNCKGYEFRRDYRHSRAVLALTQAAKEQLRLQLEMEILDLYR